MTNNQHGQVPAIQRETGCNKHSLIHCSQCAHDKMVQGLRDENERLHAYCQELESQVIRDCMTHVQTPAEIEHVAGDVSKNGAEVNMSTQPVAQQGETSEPTPPKGEELRALSDRYWGREDLRDAHAAGVTCGFALGVRALRTQQPAPATQQEAQQPTPSAAAAVVVYEQKENEMQVWFRPARMHGHPERTPIKATITKDRGNGIVDLTYDDGEFSGNARAVPNALRLPRNVREQVAVWWDVGFEMDFQTAVDNSLKKKKDDPPPQPSPTPQADSQPAPVTQQAGKSVAIQWLAEMIMSDCGCSTQNQRLLDRIIERITQYERANTSTQSEGGAQAPMIDAEATAYNEWFNGEQGTAYYGMWEFARAAWMARAARAPADSVTAPADGAVAVPSKHLPYEPTSTMLIAARERDPALPIETVRAIYWAMWRKAPTPPAQTADSVLEDAARLEFEMQHGSAIDAVRKQGANHD